MLLQELIKLIMKNNIITPNETSMIINLDTKKNDYMYVTCDLFKIIKMNT